MKNKISEDSEKVVYEFSSNGKTKQVTYHKCCYIFFPNQQVDFDEISENDFQNWKNYLN